MEAQRTRRSDRIVLELPIQVSGTDGLGHGFMEETRTLVLSRHGAKILGCHKLGPDQELSVRCHKTGKEVVARVVGQIGGGPGGYHYGVEFLDPDVNLWDIDFPPLVESEEAVARVLLECVRCHAQVLTYLNEFEAEVFEANGCLSRSCKRCTDTSIWKAATSQAPSEQIPLPVKLDPAPAAAPAVPLRTQNERKVVRVSLKITACIRHPQFGEEIVVTENVSRGGFRFKSPKCYSRDSIVEVAVPYSRGAGNIFTPARIEHAEQIPGEPLTSYGAAYIPVHKGWPGK